MEYYININPKTKNHLQKGDELELSMVERNIKVTVTRTDKEKVFFEATGEDGKYLKNLYEEAAKTLEIQTGENDSK